MARMTVSQALAVARAHLEAGRLVETVEVCKALLPVAPQESEVYRLLGVVALVGKAMDRATEFMLNAVACDPSSGEAHHGLAQVWQALQRTTDAEAELRQAVALRPDLDAAWCDLGNLYADQNREEAAEAAYSKAIALPSKNPHVLRNLALLRQRQGRVEEAETLVRRALEVKPDFAEAASTLGTALSTQMRLVEAEAAYREALRLKPDLPDAFTNLGTALYGQGRTAEAAEVYWQAVAAQPDFAGGMNNALATDNYLPGVTLAKLAETHARFEARFAAPLRSQWRPHANRPDPERPLRLGFVSADFGNHPVGYFLIQPLEHLDRRQFTVFAYSDRPSGDAMRGRLRAHVDAWRDVNALSDAELAEQVRRDEIDILFDLAGHTYTRLLMFARKPAPIQITWIGYVGTTGLSAMDYVLADRYEVPVEAEPYYRERVLRMPDDYVCFDPGSDVPDVGPLPALHNGYVTFGSLNRLAKIGPHVIDAWAEILRRVPRSHITIKFLGFENEPVRDRYRAQFVERGIAAERVELEPPSHRRAFMEHYNRIDVGLDTFPYAGGLTTCEALWMGVPVVTLPGETFASRHSLSHLNNAGLPDMVAGSVDEYIAKSVALANDLPGLAALRARLRAQVAASPLCDGVRFTRNFEMLMRQVWRQWVTQR